MIIFQTKKRSIPQQKKGAKSDTSHSAKFKSTDEAKPFFKVAQKRLLDVSKWHLLSGMGSATFVLTDNSGNKVRRNAKEGDYLRIDVPGPGSKKGDGYDWVKIELIEKSINWENDSEELLMRARPSNNPKDATKKSAHFFEDSATSTFIIKREKNIVQAEIHGRNELPNVHQENKIDSIRNAFVAVGAMLGFSKFQWKKLVKGLVSQSEDT